MMAGLLSGMSLWSLRITGAGRGNREVRFMQKQKICMPRTVTNLTSKHIKGVSWGPVGLIFHLNALPIAPM